MLTGRDCGMSKRAPMCGVPYHAVDSYVTRLIDKGYKVAICEQMEDPALAKGLVERDVIRIITPGTVIEERMLSDGENSFIASVAFGEDEIGLAYADVSTGSFYAISFSEELPEVQLTDELARIQPREVVAGPQLKEHVQLDRQISVSSYVTRYSEQSFAFNTAAERLKQHFGVASLSGFGLNDLPVAVSACGALMQYLEETQKNALSHIHEIRVLNRSSYMTLDASTRRNLELVAPLRFGGSKKNTLLYLIDQTKSNMGSRMVRDWVDRPLRSAAAINRRLDAVEELYTDLETRKRLQERIHGIYDIERLCSKIVYATLNARDCAALLQTLDRIPSIKAILAGCRSEPLRTISDRLDEMVDVHDLLLSAIVDDPPVSVKEGGIIKSGYNAEVDELRSISEGSHEWLKNFEASERERSGIKNLRIGYNRVFGYYIEITRSNLSSVPYNYERKQTLANAERFITPELKEMETKILGANERLIALEFQIFNEIRQVLLSCTERLQEDAALLAETDCYQSFAEAAARFRYTRPSLNIEGRIEIKNGRHPVIEQSLKEPFVPNDVLLDQNENRLIIITGPNMAGKSTYMRQTALIALMAHIGMFVPADKADISILDRIFTRIGASDDLSGGQSTFMVEMSEVANILNNATDASLLILDEIGRGTSTFDGLSIAWSVLEYIANEKRCGAKTLFSTHYHELTELEGKLPGVKNYRVTVKEIGDDIVFLRKIARGGADRSFGIQVARLAGLPELVLRRAKTILKDIERTDVARGTRKLAEKEAGEQQALFGFADQKEMEAIRRLKEVDIERMTPLEALNELNSISAILN